MPKGLSRPASRLVLGVLTALAALTASPASAHHVVTEQLSRGPAGGDGAFTSAFAGASRDGSHVFFGTAEGLVAGDANGRDDLYEHVGGTVRVVSAPAAGAPDAVPGTVRFLATSSDGTRTVFATERQLAAADTDGDTDVYERVAGETHLLTGDVTIDGGQLLFWGATPDARHVFFLAGSPLALHRTGAGGTEVVAEDVNLNQGGLSEDGDAVAFTTDSQLVAGDTDAKLDVYRWTHGGGVERVTTANGAFDATGKGMSADGLHVYLETREALAGTDTDGETDVYEWVSGAVRQVSVGGPGTGSGNAATHAHFQRASDDGSRIFFTSWEPLTTDDVETLADPDFPSDGTDLFVREGGTTTTLVSKGKANPYTSEVVFAAISRDGAHAYFNTWEPLTDGDQDPGFLDAYDRSGGQTRLLSTADGHEADFTTSGFAGAAQDGDPAYFSVDGFASFDPLDRDKGEDIYLRDGPRTALATTGAVSGASDPDPTWVGVSDDGLRGWYTTWEKAAASDADGACPPEARGPCRDVYEARLTGDPPAVDTGPGALAYTEGDAPVPVAPALTLTAPLGAIDRATVRVDEGHAAGDSLAVTAPQGLAVSVAGDTLTLSGDASAATYAVALRSVTFAHPGVAPVAGARTFAIRVRDAEHESTPALRAGTVTAVDQAPVLDAGPAPAAAFTEDGEAVLVAPGLGVSDVDDAALVGATVTALGGAPGDELTVDAPGLTVVAAGPTVTLTGNAPLAAYAAALRTVRYRSTSQDPATSPRTVRFTVDDGDRSSAAADRTVTVAARNDAPVVTLPAAPVERAAGAGPAVIGSGLTLEDPDSPITGATARLTAGRAAGADVLTAPGAAAAGLTTAWDGETLTLAGAASAATYRDVLRGLTFDTTVSGRRTLQVRAEDGQDAGDAAARALHAFPAAPAVTAPAPLTARPAMDVVFAGEAGASFTCAVDGGAPAPCGSPFVTPPLADGAHELRVAQAVDGLPSPAATARWTLDATAPGPPRFTAAPVGRAAATFSWVGAEPGGAFECSADGAAASPCAAPTTLTPPGPGTHRFSVRQVDAAGNRSAPAVHAWTVPAATVKAARPSGLRVTVLPGVRVRAGRLAVTCRLAKGSLKQCTVQVTRGGRPVGRLTRRVARRGVTAVRVNVPVSARGRRGRLVLRATVRAHDWPAALTARRTIVLP